MKLFSRRTALMLTGLASAASLLGASGAAADITVDSDPILYWNNQAQALLPGSTPIQSRGFAMVNIAMHDAVNATTGSQDRYYLSGVVSPGGDTRVAASQAARNVLVALDPAKTAQYDAALADFLRYCDAAPAGHVPSKRPSCVTRQTWKVPSKGGVSNICVMIPEGEGHYP